ncbi:unnamed protein product, partial [Chrysoparadoxa australica]
QGKRARQLKVDVAHRVRGEGFLDPEREPDEAVGSVTADDIQGKSCLFQGEMDRCKEMNTTGSFKRFYYKAKPLVQSLPELLHNAGTVLDMMMGLLESNGSYARTASEVMQLLAVMARDLQSAFYPHFHRSMKVLVQVVVTHGGEPEDASRCVKCIGYLLKFSAKPLLKDVKSIKQYYGPLLGHKRDFVRRYSAEVLSSLLRKLKPKALKLHTKQFLQVLYNEFAQALPNSYEAPSALLHFDVCDGCSSLLFGIVKVGVHGRMHSKGPGLLRTLLDALRNEPDVQKQRWSLQLVEATLKLLVNHVRSPHSDELWMELHYGLGIAGQNYEKALNRVSPGGGKAAKDTTPHQSNSDTLDHLCASLNTQMRCMSLVLGHMGGVLLREPAIALKHAPLLAKELNAVTSPLFFRAASTSPAYQTTAIEIVVQAMDALHAQPSIGSAIPDIVKVIASSRLEGSRLVEGPLRACCSQLCTSNAGAHHPALILSRKLLGLGGISSSRHSRRVALFKELALPELLTAAGGPLSDDTELAIELLASVITDASQLDLSYVSLNLHLRLTIIGVHDLDAEPESQVGVDDDDCICRVQGMAPLGKTTCLGLLQLCEQSMKTIVTNHLSLLSQSHSASEAEAAVGLHCIPFVFSAIALNDRRGLFNGIAKSIDKLVGDSHPCTDVRCAESTVLLSLAVEAAVLCCCLLPRSEWSSCKVRDRLVSWNKSAMKSLKASPHSIASLRACSISLKTLSTVDPSRDAVPAADVPVLVDEIAPNLSSQQKLRRYSLCPLPDHHMPYTLHAARLLACLPALRDISSSQAKVPSLVVGVEELGVCLTNDREFVVKLSKLEVIARDGSLPEPYVKMLAHHSQGLM